MTSREWNLGELVPAMEVLEQERQARGMTVTSLASESGVAVGTSHAWRVSNRTPRLDLFVALADTLGFEVVMRKKGATPAKGKASGIPQSGNHSKAD